MVCSPSWVSLRHPGYARTARVDSLGHHRLAPGEPGGEGGMPTVHAEKLMEIASALLEKAGASAEEAATIARYNIGANLVGHDSHGIILIPSYIDRIKVGHIMPGAPFDVKEQSPTTTVIDGNWGFGYVVTDRAMRMTIDKAKQQNVAATTVFRQSHI